MNIIITGGTGFIGAHVVRRLHRDGHALLLIVRKKTSRFSDLDRVTYLEGDLLDVQSHKGAMEAFRPDALVHLAWQGIPDYGIENCKRNMSMGLEIISLAGALGCSTCVVTGSCWEYGRDRGALQEDMETTDKNVFCATKNALCKIGAQIAKEKKMRFTWLRLFYVYGPGQRNGSLIPTILHAARKGIPPGVQNPANRNDFVFVEDVADAVSKAVQKSEGGIFNIGSGRSTSLHTVMETLYRSLRVPFDGKQGGEGADFWADISKAKATLGWEPRTDIEEGIRRMVEEGAYS